MRREVFRYTFQESVPLQDVEETLLVAVLAIGSLFGESSVRLDASYAMDADRRGCVIDGSTEVGRGISRVFIGLASREFGDESFTVRRAYFQREPASASWRMRDETKDAENGQFGRAVKHRTITGKR